MTHYLSKKQTRKLAQGKLIKLRNGDWIHGREIK